MPALPIREDLSPAELRRLAKAETDVRVARRLLARLSRFAARDPENWRISAIGSAKVGTAGMHVMLKPELPSR